MPRKRTHDEMVASEPEVKKETPSLLQTIRNMWEFASTMQFIFMFGKALKIDEDFDIEDFETECLKPGHSDKLEELGLSLLKWISSHRGLNHDIWDEYTRRQYRSKAPEKNPYGEEEEPKRFRDFDILTRIRILHQLTVWTMWNPDRIREKMTEHQREVDQLEWRVEEFGYDKDDRQYYLLDDNRFYRRTEPPIPSGYKVKPKANTKKAIAARRRASKRRKIDSETPEPEEELDSDHREENGEKQDEVIDPSKIDTFGGYKWECLAITLTDYQDLCQSFAKTKDPNEKLLRQRIIDEVMPILEQAEERQRRKIERRERELVMMERMVGAKRSSRLADKQDKERRDIEQAEAERKRHADLEAARREQQKQDKMEKERQFRMMTREQRIKEREYKRILKEEELAKDAAEQKRIEEGEVRGSGRHLKDRIEKNKKELEELAAEEDWTFDCSGCGVYGRNFDDGAHSVACERCNVWQHSKCIGVSKSAAEKDDFHFVCKDCRQKEEDAKKPKISLKFRLGTSSSPVPPSPAVSQTQLSPQLNKAIPINNRPPSQGQVNGFQQYSPPRQQISSPYQPQTSPSNAYSQPRPSQYAQSPPAVSLQFHNSFASGNRPPSAGYASIQPRSPPVALSNGSPQPYPSPIRPAQSIQPLQHSASVPQSRPFISQSPPLRPVQPSFNGQPTQSANNANTPRLPSPVLNRPSMSPTQGNMDVGAIAGIPNKSPPMNGQSQFSNGQPPYPLQVTPRPVSQGQSQTPSIQTPNSHQAPLSGLSPKKHMTPIPAPAPSVNLFVPKAGTMSPPRPNAQSQRPPSQTSHGNPADQRRSISGTPVVPPVENLRPSPEQMRNMSSNINDPVPTPSKHQQQLSPRLGYPSPNPQIQQNQGLGIVNVNGTHLKPTIVSELPSAPPPNPTTTQAPTK